jgi:hypothetical protein
VTVGWIVEQAVGTSRFGTVFVGLASTAPLSPKVSHARRLSIPDWTAHHSPRKMTLPAHLCRHLAPATCDVNNPGSDGHLPEGFDTSPMAWAPQD